MSGSIRSARICGKKGLALTAALVVVAASFTVAWVIYRWDLGITLTVDTDKSEYGAGEPVKMKLKLKNNGFSKVDLVYGNSATLKIAIYDSDGSRVIYEPKVAFMMITKVTLKPGGTLNWEYTWNQVNDSGEQVELPGTFTVLAFSPSSKHVYQMESTFSISS